jgi:hypothetical protein
MFSFRCTSLFGILICVEFNAAAEAFRPINRPVFSLAGQPALARKSGSYNHI